MRRAEGFGCGGMETVCLAAGHSVRGAGGVCWRGAPPPSEVPSPQTLTNEHIIRGLYCPAKP